jgi:aromatic ring-cleaving dioxygenase
LAGTLGRRLLRAIERANDLLPVIVPWVQLNSLGLTILLHPNTDDPRADHLYYTLWVNRSLLVNAFNMPIPRDKDGKALIKKILPNVTPTVKLEV